jgi:TonB family protein
MDVYTYITENGKVIIAKSTGDQRLDKAAMEALNRWLFKPAPSRIPSVHLNRALRIDDVPSYNFRDPSTALGMI